MQYNFAIAGTFYTIHTHNKHILQFIFNVQFGCSYVGSIWRMDDIGFPCLWLLRLQAQQITHC
jgi:hypothetical protein